MTYFELQARVDHILYILTCSYLFAVTTCPIGSSVAAIRPHVFNIMRNKVAYTSTLELNNLAQGANKLVSSLINRS